MTKNEIVITATIAITSGIVSVLIGIYLTIYAQQKKPDINKINSYIKKCFFFTLKYVIPISEIIILSIYVDIKDLSILKLYIFNICLLFSLLLFNFIIDVIDKYNKVYREINSYQFEKLDELIEFVNNNNKCIKCLCDINKSIKNIISKPLELPKKN